MECRARADKSEILQSLGVRCGAINPPYKKTLLRILNTLAQDVGWIHRKDFGIAKDTELEYGKFTHCIDWVDTSSKLNAESKINIDIMVIH